jgi:hypothetical protein
LQNEVQGVVRAALNRQASDRGQLSGEAVGLEEILPEEVEILRVAMPEMESQAGTAGQRPGLDPTPRD